MSSITEIPLTYLSNKLNGKMIETGIDTNEQVVLEELLYMVAETYITRTETVLHTRVISVSYTHLDVYKRQLSFFYNKNLAYNTTLYNYNT